MVATIPVWIRNAETLLLGHASGCVLLCSRLPWIYGTLVPAGVVALNRAQAPRDADKLPASTVLGLHICNDQPSEIGV
jgi:hypothetical protein